MTIVKLMISVLKIQGFLVLEKSKLTILRILESSEVQTFTLKKLIIDYTYLRAYPSFVLTIRGQFLAHQY
jgi:hypothetical protein